MRFRPATTLRRAPAALLLVACCCLPLACGDETGSRPLAAPPAEEAATAEPVAAPPDLSYPGEEAGTAGTPAGEPANAPAEAAPPGPGEPPPLEAVRIFLVELDAGGAAAGEGAEEAAPGDTFGCGDRLRAVEVPVASEGLDTAGRIGAALAALLAAHGGPEVPGDLYNVFARSGLTVDRVEAVPGIEGYFRIHLAGELVLGGVCDNPRVRAQLEATARQFAGVDDVEIVVGDRPLEALLSGRG